MSSESSTLGIKIYYTQIYYKSHKILLFLLQNLSARTITRYDEIFMSKLNVNETKDFRGSLWE